MKTSEKGASTVEYAMLISLCSLICIAAIAQVGFAARSKFYFVSDSMSGVDTTGLNEEGEDSKIATPPLNTILTFF